MNKIRAIFVLRGAVAVAAFGQERSLWRTAPTSWRAGAAAIVGTVTDIEAGPQPHRSSRPTTTHERSHHRRRRRGVDAVQRLRRDDQRRAGDLRRIDRLREHPRRRPRRSARHRPPAATSSAPNASRSSAAPSRRRRPASDRRGRRLDLHADRVGTTPSTRARSHRPRRRHRPAGQRRRRARSSSRPTGARC